MIKTSSEAISFARELEKKGQEFYEELARRFPQFKDLFSAFAEENRKFSKHIERVYYSVITDALEGGFAFNLSPENYELDLSIKDDLALPEAVEKVKKVEEVAISFYNEAAEQSLSLMADIPRAFKFVAGKRTKRLQKLPDQGVKGGT